MFRHDRFASGGFDLGIFDQTIWGYSRFAIVHNTVKGTPNLLGDHFHPVLMALAPLYWVWDDARVLLVAQALLIAAASLPIFFWALPRVGFGGAACAQAAFVVFWGVLAGVMFDFHELAVAAAVISFGLYALLERRRRLFWIMFVLGCLTKEDVALTFAAMGVYAFLVQHRRQFGLAVAAVAAGWFGVTVSAIVPAISGRPYHYWNYPGLGPTPAKALLAVVERPYRALTLAFDKPEKRATLTKLLGAWAFLPLVSPILLIAIPSLAERFWAGNPNLWSTSFQYSLPVAPVLAFAAIDGAARIARLRSRWKRHVPATVLLAGVFVSGLVLTGVVVRPLAPLGRYMSAARAAATDRCLDAIPPEATVAASEPLVPHLTHRLDITRLSRRHGERYLAVWASRRRPFSALTYPAYRVVCTGGAATVVVRRES